MRDLLQPYDPQWAAAFASLRSRLLQALPDPRPGIVHVGSTAIPGLPAKPILDVDIILSGQQDFPRVESALVALGYLSRGDQGIPGRFAFRQSSEATPHGASTVDADSPGDESLTQGVWMPHHLYVCLPDSLALRNHLCFRDALLADPQLADRYGRLKRALVKEPGMDRERYTRAKTDFVLDVLAAHGFSADEIAEIAAANR